MYTKGPEILALRQEISSLTFMRAFFIQTPIDILKLFRIGGNMKESCINAGIRSEMVFAEAAGKTIKYPETMSE